MEATGHIMHGGTIVDATIISAPSSTKNAEKKRDPEMYQTKKGNVWKFGMKCHIGVDSGSGLVHTITATAANAHDITEAHKLLREDDHVAYGDSGYIGIEKRDEIKNNEHFRKIDFRINRRPKSLPQVSDHAIDWERYIENRKSAVRCKVEHAFKSTVAFPEQYSFTIFKHGKKRLNYAIVLRWSAFDIWVSWWILLVQKEKICTFCLWLETSKSSWIFKPCNV